MFFLFVEFIKFEFYSLLIVSDVINCCRRFIILWYGVLWNIGDGNNIWKIIESMFYIYVKNVMDVLFMLYKRCGKCRMVFLRSCYWILYIVMFVVVIVFWFGLYVWDKYEKLGGIVLVVLGDIVNKRYFFFVVEIKIICFSNYYGLEKCFLLCE